MKLLKITTIAATLFAMVVIMLGSFTRLADAGLGCPDWPGCYGHILWPNETHEIEKANQAYPDMPVDQAKTWPEMVHRYLASSLGLMMIIMVALAYRVKDTVVPKGHIWGLLGLVIVQGLFGMWTVTLKLWPQVVTTHLLGGFLTFNLLFLLSLRLTNWRLPVTHDTSRIVSLKKLALLSLVWSLLFRSYWVAGQPQTMRLLHAPIFLYAKASGFHLRISLKVLISRNILALTT